MDSSPQFGQDWEITEVVYILDPVAAFVAIRRMAKMMPDINDADSETWGLWCDALSGDETKEIQQLHREILDSGMKHVLIPAILGARHSGLINKLHSLLHSAKMDMRTWRMVKAAIGKASGFVSDQGTEHLVKTVHGNFESLQASGNIPRLLDPSGRIAEPNQQPEVVDPEEGSSCKRRRIGEPNVGAGKADLDTIDLEAELENLLDVDAPPSASAMDLEAELAKVPDVDVPPSPVVVDLENDEATCKHPGCCLPAFTVCVHCHAELCHLHCGALACGNEDAAARVRLNETQSRCHEHLYIPTSQRSLTRSCKGYIRCPCQQCVQERAGLLCPCPSCTPPPPGYKNKYTYQQTCSVYLRAYVDAYLHRHDVRTYLYVYISTCRPRWTWHSTYRQ